MSVTKVKVKPKDGVQVRLENGQVMPEKGADIVLTRYYRRRIADGDLVRVESKKTATTAAKTGDK